jgi:hypothetical protein
MLGRSQTKLDNPEAAAAAFQLAHDWASRGVPDPQGLAVASYGEEARLHIRNALKLAAGNDFSTNPDIRRRYAEAIGTSMRLYADQAAYGSDSGANSLEFVASSVLQSADRIGAVLDDPFVARALFAYTDASAPSEDDAAAGGSDDQGSNPPTAETPLVTAIKAHGVAGLPDVDRIAALLYQDGQFDLAFELADKLDTPLAYWLKAKRSVSQGDLPAAAENYRRAIAAFPTTHADPTLTDRGRQRLIGESGAVAMGRGDFLQALGLLAESGYVDEAVYIAERIITIQELKDFLAGAAGNPPAIDKNTRQALDDLLARRLMRVGLVRRRRPRPGQRNGNPRHQPRARPGQLVLECPGLVGQKRCSGTLHHPGGARPLSQERAGPGLPLPLPLHRRRRGRTGCGAAAAPVPGLRRGALPRDRLDAQHQGQAGRGAGGTEGPSALCPLREGGCGHALGDRFRL